MIDVNLNVRVRFRLTPEGAAAWHKAHPEQYDLDLNRWVPADPPPANTPMQLIEAVGHAVRMSRPPPTVGNTFTIITPVERVTLEP